MQEVIIRVLMAFLACYMLGYQLPTTAMEYVRMSKKMRIDGEAGAWAFCFRAIGVATCVGFLVLGVLAAALAISH